MEITFYHMAWLCSPISKRLTQLEKNYVHLYVCFFKNAVSIGAAVVLIQAQQELKSITLGDVFLRIYLATKLVQNFSDSVFKTVFLPPQQ